MSHVSPVNAETKSEDLLPSFVGAGRTAIVADLVERFRALPTKGPQLVCLVAPPGRGKTRIVQQFYRELAAQQPLPAYWPQDILGAEGPEIRAVLEGRKRVYPLEVVVSEGAKMSWLWWAIPCQRRLDGQLSQAMFDESTQLLAHADSLLGRGSLLVGAGKAFELTSAVVGLLGLLGVALFPPAGIALGVGGAARTGWQNRDLIKGIARFRDERPSTVDVSSYGRADEIATIASQLIQISKRVPIVLVIDDAHYADGTLVETLNVVLGDPTAQVLAIATVWPQELDDPTDAAPFPAWWNREHVGRARDHAVRLEVEELGPEMAAALVVADLPGADPELTRWVIDRWGTNPLVLRSLIRLPKVRDALTNGEADLESLSQLPRQIESLFAEYWDNLPDRIQIALAMAAWLGTDYVPDVVAQAVCAAKGDSARDAVTEAVSPYAWARKYDDSLNGFIEPALWEIANRGADDILGKSDRALVRTALQQFVRETPQSLLPERTLVTVWGQYVLRTRKGEFPGDDLAAAAAVNLSHHMADRLQYSTAAELAEDALQWGTYTATQDASLRRERGRWLMYAGRFGESRDELERALRSFRTEGSAVEAAETLRDLGDAFRYLGNLPAAVEHFTAALAEFEASDDWLDAASALCGAGDACRGLARWHDSHSYFDRCLELYRKHEQHQLLSVALVKYGILLRDQNRYTEATKMYMQALSWFRASGDRRWEARTLRHLAVVDRNAGRLLSAIKTLGECLNIFAELGDERGAGVTYRNRGDTYRLLGDIDSAKADFGRAMAIFIRLGDSRWVARTQVSIADIHRRARDWTECARLLTSALSFSRSIDDQHAIGRTLRAEALMMRDRGDMEAAVLAFQGSFDRFQALGDRVWLARALMGLATVRGRNGDPDKTLADRAFDICREEGSRDRQTSLDWLAEW